MFPWLLTLVPTGAPLGIQLAVAGLADPDFLVEVEAIAVIDDVSVANS